MFFNFFFIIYKKRVIWPKEYHENDKERLRKQATDKYGDLSKEEKNRKREHGKNRYHNMSEEKKKINRISKKLSRG